MEEEKVFFKSDGCTLEGLCSGNRSSCGVVITHPHPLYGGDMYSPVVEAIASAYHRCGFRTLRFNFRGTGQSSGRHTQGDREPADVATAITVLKSRAVDTIHLSGYSFGAWVNALALGGEVSVDQVTMVAPPVAFIDFATVGQMPHLIAVIAGERDEFAPPDLIRRQMQKWNPAAVLEVIPGADHFFLGFLDQMALRLSRQLKRLP